MTELETMQRAKMYMEKLAQGIDPVSGQEIPEDSVLSEIGTSWREEPLVGMNLCPGLSSMEQNPKI